MAMHNPPHPGEFIRSVYMVRLPRSGSVLDADEISSNWLDDVMQLHYHVNHLHTHQEQP